MTDTADLIAEARMRCTYEDHPDEWLDLIADLADALEASEAALEVLVQAQGLADDEREAYLPVASPDTWGWDACVVCGSEDVTDRGMIVMTSPMDGPYVSRIAWCDQTQECRDDLRQSSFLLTEADSEVIDAALRAASKQGGKR